MARLDVVDVGAVGLDVPSLAPNGLLASSHAPPPFVKLLEPSLRTTRVCGSRSGSSFPHALLLPERLRPL